MLQGVLILRVKVGTLSHIVIEKIFRKMLGQVCWRVLHYQINLSFNLGKPRLVVESCPENPVKDRLARRFTRIKAEWFFWVYHGYWKLTVVSLSGKEKLVATSSSGNTHKNEVCRLLNGQRLTRVEIDNRTGRTVLLFDLGAELVIRRPESQAKELWSLAEPNGYYLCINGDGTYDHKPGSGTDGRPSVKSRPVNRTVAVE